MSTYDNDEKNNIITTKELVDLSNCSECAMFIAQPGTQMEILYANQTFYDWIQYSEEEFAQECNSSIMALILSEDKQKVRNLIARQTAFGGKLQLELRVRKKDHSILWLSVTETPAMQNGRSVYYGSCLDVTQVKESLSEMYQAKRDVELIANNIPGGVMKLRMTDFKLLYANDGFYRLAGYSKEEYQVQFGGYCDQVLHPTDKAMVQKQIATALENRGVIGFEYRIMAKSGEIRWSYVNGCRVDDDQGQPVYLCIIMDITKRKELERQSEENAKRAELIARFMRETTWTYDVSTGTLSRSGNLGETYSNEAVLEGQFQKDQLKAILHPDDVTPFLNELRQRSVQLGEHRAVYRIKDSFGEYRRMEVGTISVDTVGDGKPDKVFGVTRLLENNVGPVVQNEIAATAAGDIGARLWRKAKNGLTRAVDSLTGMVSYGKFLEQASDTLAARDENLHYAVLCADIDEFRKFNHHYGFSISNEILKRFSKVMRKYTENGGVCARVDGDYFVGMFIYEDHKSLLKMLSEMMRYQDELNMIEKQIAFNTTNGLYLVQPEDEELGDMLEKADLARRSIKGIRGNHYAIYTEDLQEERFKEERIIQEIYEAMEGQTIEIGYLPRILGDKENVVGCKAAAQIQLKDGQYLYSDAILHYIERGGRLEKFSFFLLNQVCCNIGAWKAKGNKVIPFSLEMTAMQLSAQNAVEIIDDIVVTQNKLDPTDLTLEVNERYFADMTSAMQINLEKLRAKGYQVVISRFGSHHTALHSLRTIPVAGIKFHGEYFTEDINHSKEKIILKHIVLMAKELDMTVCCGGICTKLQEQYAKEIGCDYLEGSYYYGAMRGSVFEKCFLE